MSEAGKAFVKKLLHPDPAKRPTAKEVQCDEWIQVWASKSSKDEKPLDQTTVSALMEFKKCSDMKKLLSEVLSFTLMPEQIVDLRQAFEKIDTDGDGEISLNALKKVLMQNAEAGALGTMTEREVEDLFDSIKVGKSETTIRWHEFLAAGLSKAKIDDRNLRLAFDRLDANRKGSVMVFFAMNFLNCRTPPLTLFFALVDPRFITFNDVAEVLGNADGDLELIWKMSLEECNASGEWITFQDFQKIIKSQPKHTVPPSFCARNRRSSSCLLSLPAQKRLTAGAALLSAAVFEAAAFDDELSRRESSCLDRRDIGAMSDFTESGSRFWLGQEDGSSAFFNQSADTELPLSLVVPTGETLSEARRTSSLLTKSLFYRHHLEMRHAVMEASKRFDQKLSDLQTRPLPHRTSLIMKRGGMEMKSITKSRRASDIEGIEDMVKRNGCSSSCPRKKTTSDIRGMIVE